MVVVEERLELQSRGVKDMEVDHLAAAEKNDKAEEAWTASELVVW